MPAPIVLQQHLVPVSMTAPYFTAAPLAAVQGAPIMTAPAIMSSVCSQPAQNYGNYNMVLNYSMELVWHGEFNRLFQSFMPSQWHLNPTFSLPKGRKWTMFKDSAKVRFLCQECSHGWTSMKGRVVFWFTFDEQRNVGMVLFRLFGQRCQSCSPKLFEHAMWYPEEVVKVVGNVFNRIGQEYYGFYSPPVRIDRRAGKPRSQHNATLCQACSEGICPGEYDSSVQTFGFYNKTPMTSSYPGSLSSQYSTDLSSNESVASSDELVSSTFDENQSDTASESSVNVITENLSHTTLEDQTDTAEGQSNSDSEDTDQQEETAVTEEA